MGKYKEIREVIINVVSDQQWHKLEELQSKCEEVGISFEDGRGPIYNITHQLKKKGKIEANGMGAYRICMQNMECDERGEIEIHSNQKKQLLESIENIEIYLAKYKHFNWINCSDEELQDARSNVVRLIELGQKIEKEFKRI